MADIKLGWKVDQLGNGHNGCVKYELVDRTGTHVCWPRGALVGMGQILAMAMGGQVWARGGLVGYKSDWLEELIGWHEDGWIRQGVGRLGKGQVD